MSNPKALLAEAVNLLTKVAIHPTSNLSAKHTHEISDLVRKVRLQESQLPRT